MIALFPDAEQAAAIADAGTETADQIHLTLVYLGKAAAFDPGQRKSIEGAVQRVASDHAKLSGVVGGTGAFQPGPDGTPVIVLPDVIGLTGLRTAVMDALQPYGITDIGHAFHPHLTAGYVDGAADVPAPPDTSLDFAAISVVWAGERLDFPLAGTTLRFAYPGEDRKAALAALKKHGSHRAAAAATGISKSTIHRWSQQDQDAATGGPVIPEPADPDVPSAALGAPEPPADVTEPNGLPETGSAGNADPADTTVDYSSTTASDPADTTTI